jgi:PAS domain S-box-containing protein
VRAEGIAALSFVPLIASSKLIGKFMAYYDAAHAFTQHETDLAVTIARQMGFAIEQSRQQALIDTIPALVWTALPDGSHTFQNRRWLEFTGIPAAAVARGGWISGFHPEDRAKILDKWRSAILTGKPFEIEARARSATGEYRTLLIRAAAFRDDTGAIVKWYGVSTDIEDRKRAEAEVRESVRRYREVQTELAHASRVATMGQLTASIAHEVNQPITAAVMNANTALRWLSARRPNLEEARRALGRIVENGNRAGEVIGRIRALIKKAPPQKNALGINDAILEVVALTHGEAVKNGVSVRTQLAEGLPTIEGDRVQLQQVILNLVINAVEAMNEPNEAPRDLLISSEVAEPDGVLVAVRDTGPGLAPDTLGRLFEAFYSTKADGMGMGLSICRSIIEAHGGRLWASANEPCGAVFQFTAPAQSRSRGVIGRGAFRHAGSGALKLDDD